MKAYLIAMFILGCIGLVVRVVWLLSDHPRPQKPVKLEADVFALLWTIGFLGWASFLLYGATP